MRTQTTFTFEACVTEMPRSSGGGMSVSISPPCSWRCAHGGGRWSGAGDRAAVVFVSLVAPRHPPPAHLWGRGWKMKRGCEDTGGRGSGLLTGRDADPLTAHTHKHTLTLVLYLSEQLWSTSPRFTGISPSVATAMLGIAPARRPLRQQSSSSGRLTARVLTCLTWGRFWQRSAANPI